MAADFLKDGIFRKMAEGRPQSLRFDGIEFCPATRMVVRDSEETRLEPRAAAVLEALIAGHGTVLRREALLDTCWPEATGSDEGLSQAVAQLRRALGDDPREPRYIGTVSKSGYRWLASMPEQPSAAIPPPAPRNWMPNLLWAALIVAILGGLGFALWLRAQPQVDMKIETGKGKGGRRIIHLTGDPRAIAEERARLERGSNGTIEVR